MAGSSFAAASPIAAASVASFARATGPVLMARAAPMAYVPHSIYVPQAAVPSSPSISAYTRSTAQLPPQPLREATAEEKAEIDRIVAEIAPDLDERAVERVYQLASPAEARNALEALVEAGDEVRNKSAYLQSIVSKRLQVAAESKAKEDEAEAASKKKVAEKERTAEFEAQLKSWGEDLDEKAQQVLGEVQATLGTEVALQVLKECSTKMEQGELRNVSGFAYSIARTRLSGAQVVAAHKATFSPSAVLCQQAAEQEQVAELQRQLDSWGEELDDKARKLLQELHERLGVAVALGVMQELSTKAEKENVRNVSSFAFSMARQRLYGAPQVTFLTQPTYVAQPASLPLQVYRSTSVPVVPAISSSPRWYKDALVKYGLSGLLDETVLQKMDAAQPERVLEILQELATKGDVRNPSAFIQKSLKDFPSARKRFAELGQTQAVNCGSWQAEKRARMDTSGKVSPLEMHPELASQLDEAARTKLQGHPDQGRVRDILAEVAAKGSEIRNPSAFIVRALNDPGRQWTAAT